MASRSVLLCSLFLLLHLIFILQGVAGLELYLGFQEQPADVIAEKNRPLILNCTVSSNPKYGPVSILWRHKGKIINDSRRRTFPNGSLSFTRVIQQKKTGESDAGEYQCIASNGMGAIVSRSAKLAISNMSRKFSVIPLPQSVEEGDVVQLSCQIVATPHPTYIWQKDSENLPQDDNRIVLLDTGVIIINGVRKTDAGNYHCIASSDGNQRYSPDASLEVATASEIHRPPQILTTDNLVVNMGDEAILECAASGYPLPEINWMRENDLEEIGESKTGENRIYFKSVKLTDSGFYICNATNQNSENKEYYLATQKINLKVRVPPEIVKHTQNLSVSTAKTARIECEVNGVPAPKVYWLKNAVPVQSRGRIKIKNNSNYELVILQTVTNDSGIYQCIAENEIGFASAQAWLQVNVTRDQPAPPKALRAQTLSSTSIELMWNASTSRNGLEINAYTVHYAPTLGGDELQKVGRNSSLLIDQLKPYTNYSFYVRSYTGRSASDQSETLVWCTGEDVPLVAPSVTLTSKSPTTLLVSWDNLPVSLARGVIIMYKVMWHRSNSHSLQVQESTGDVHDYVITGLIPGGQYEVRVLGGTKIGYPNLPDSEWPWTKHEMPVQTMYKVPFLTLDLIVINSTAILAKWKYTESNEIEIQGFKLSYRKRNENLYGPLIIPVNGTTEFMLTDLTPHSWYEVHILAYNNQGDGRESVRNILTLDPQPPIEEIPVATVVEPPSHLEALPTSSTSINVSWRNPITTRIISYFTVRYNPASIVKALDASAVNYILSTGKEVVITDLLPYTLYEFSVCSHDQDNKRGPYSKVVACKTGEDIPTAPTDLQWKPVDSNTVVLSWQPPEQPNGLITNYFIMYNTVKTPEYDPHDWITKEEEGSTLSAKINGLASNTRYYFCLSAKTSVGTGPPTDIITLNIPISSINQSGSTSVYDEDLKDPRLGIIVGVSIGIGCMIICALVIAIRNRLFSSTDPYHHYIHHYHLHGNGQIMSNHCNGHGENQITSTDSNNGDSLIPMLNYANENTANHLDTKGGYPGLERKLNGFPQSILHKVHLLNGHTVRDKPAINITENPQQLAWNESSGYYYDSELNENVTCSQPSSLPDITQLDSNVNDDITVSDCSEKEDGVLLTLPSQQTENDTQVNCSLQGSEPEESSVAGYIASCHDLPKSESRSILPEVTLQHADASLQAHPPS